LCFLLLSKNVKTKTYRIVILPVVLYDISDCERRTYIEGVGEQGAEENICT
jgi:hypothetical protein